MTQVVKHLPSKHEALSSNPTSTKTNKQQQQQKTNGIPLLDGLRKRETTFLTKSHPRGESVELPPSTSSFVPSSCMTKC
jgi:hypothetical protein